MPSRSRRAMPTCLRRLTQHGVRSTQRKRPSCKSQQRSEHGHPRFDATARLLRSHKSASFLAILEQGRAWRAGARSLSLALAAIGVPERGMARNFLQAGNLLPWGWFATMNLPIGDAVVVALQRCTRCVLGAWPRLADD